MLNYTSVENAVKLIPSNSRVFIHGSAATPIPVIKSLFDRAGEVTNVELVSISTFGDMEWSKPGITDHFKLNSLFVSDNVRKWVDGPDGEYVPTFLSEIPQLFEEGYLPLDAAIVQVSPPDKHGFISLGTSVDAAFTAVKVAPITIAMINPNMPRVHGDGVFHISSFSAVVEIEFDLPEVDYDTKSTPITEKIGEYVASIIEDGSTLQMGIGAIPNSVLKCLGNHKELGIHTEMFSDGIIPLVEKGVITNEHKVVNPRKIVSSFILGTRKLYDFVDDNASVILQNVAYVNNPVVIAQNPKVVAINSAIEIDLTGQVCADSIGPYQYSGIGGQMDFMRGAALSKGGKPIIAMPSTTNKGISRIVPYLKEGAGVVTTRGHIHYVVTEYGIINLKGKNFEQRARLLISIAHPDSREALMIAFEERFKKPF